MAFGETVVAKLDPSGSSVWTKTFAATGATWTSISPGGLALDTAGRTIITGWFIGDVDFGPAVGRFSTGGPPYVYQKDLYVVALEEGGLPIRARSFGTAGDDFGFSVAADDLGNIFVAGTCGENRMGVLAPLPYSCGANPRSEPDGLLLHLDTSGSVIDAQVFGADNFQRAETIIAHSVGSVSNVFVQGNFRNSIFLGRSQLISDGPYDLDGFLAWFSF